MTDNVHPSRDATAPELCQPPRHSKNRRRPKREAKRREAQCQPFAAQHQQTSPSAEVPQTSVRELAQLIRCAAARHIGARPPSGASTAALAGTPIPTQLQAMFPGTWNQAGVTRPLLSQSSDSTSRLGRNTEGPDARSRSGADCEAARKHRTRSTLRIASGMRPSNERASAMMGTIVK